ncbi:hypothetical protein [uncultured Winogradskyella sp.]|uniref:hypothetical protein n=1 Tax=uncultured Winogradskyella sp. TaxID=395353 RepID=UPI00260A2AEE|nr:hypothetical protein [uncultured Winogradskyella sp.]
MKKLQVLAVALICFSGLIAQQSFKYVNESDGLKMETDYSSDDQEIRDILSFEGIDYMKLKFEDKGLKGKSYKLTVKEIWDGKVKSESTVFDSKKLGLPEFETLSEAELKFRLISKRTNDNKLKMTFKFPRFSITKQYDALKSDDYSLRNIAHESNLELKYNEEFYLFAYILPYEREDGSKSWCEVGTAGKDLENWGKRFGIKHYLLFEMKFE